MHFFAPVVISVMMKASQVDDCCEFEGGDDQSLYTQAVTSFYEAPDESPWRVTQV